MYKKIPIYLSLALLFAAPTAATAQDRPANFGEGSNFSLENLPPGLLKSRLQDLPPQARSRALDWLNGVSFPASDVAHMRVDPQGGIYYVDTNTEEVEGAVVSEVDSPSGISAAETFSLHSNPGASNVIYLDFDGHVITGTGWNFDNVDPLYARPFDSDNNESSFSASELDAIAEVWYRVAEDFAAFDVDVTTEEPSVFGSTTSRVLITPDVDANGAPLPAQGAGGVAYLNVFGRSNYEYYLPAFVYSSNLSNFAPYIAEAASHEAGHNFGLSHDGTSTRSYYSGHGTGATSWGPIMGTGYNDNVSQWSRGEYADANNTQDDIGILTEKMGSRIDDHGDVFSSATLLQINSNGAIGASTPESDPFNVIPENKGIVNSVTDTDVFMFSAGAGQATLNITPSWAAWFRASNGRGTNLDVDARLYDSAGTLVASAEPIDETNAIIDINLSAGDYYLSIAGTGNATSPYTDYGSQGQYFITGSVVVDTSEPPTPDTAPPNPNPMTFASAPVAASDTEISMTATLAVDESNGAVEYYFASDSANDSGWIQTRSFTATRLAPESTYAWQVKARDASGNETAYSAASSATTDPTPVTPEPPTAVTGFTVTDNGSGGADINWTGSENTDRFEIYREVRHKRNRWRSNTLIASVNMSTTSYTDSTASGTVRYRILSINSSGSTFSSWVEVTISGGGGGGNGDCKGGPKKCGR